jgi:hypothetical protein
LREQITDACEQRLELARSMIVTVQGSREARRLFRHAVYFIRRRATGAVNQLAGTPAEVEVRLRDVLYAAQAAVCDAGWPVQKKRAKHRGKRK